MLLHQPRTITLHVSKNILYIAKLCPPSLPADPIDLTIALKISFERIDFQADEV